VSAAERLFDSLRDLLYAWTHRLKPRLQANPATPVVPPVPSIDLDELLDRHEARLSPSRDTARVERVTMHDHAVSNLFDRRESLR